MTTPKTVSFPAMSPPITMKKETAPKSTELNKPSQPGLFVFFATSGDGESGEEADDQTRPPAPTVRSDAILLLFGSTCDWACVCVGSLCVAVHEKSSSME